MKIKSVAFLCLVFILPAVESHGQLNPYQWRLGLGTGYSSYLSTDQMKGFSSLEQIFDLELPLRPEKNWTLSLEKRLNPSFGLALHGGELNVEGSVKYSDPQQLGTDQKRYFQTSVVNFGSSLVFRTDNGKIIRENARVAPYLSIGARWMQKHGESYLHGPESSTSALAGGMDKEIPFSDENFYWTGGLGIRLKLNNQLELFIQSNMLGNFSTYNDNEASMGLTDQNSMREKNFIPSMDWIFNHRLGLKFSFVPAKSAYRANVISPSTSMATSGGEKKPEIPAQTTTSQPKVSKNDPSLIFQDSLSGAIPKLAGEQPAIATSKDIREESRYFYPNYNYGATPSPAQPIISSSPVPEYRYRVIYNNPPLSSDGSGQEAYYLRNYGRSFNSSGRSAREPIKRNEFWRSPLWAVPAMVLPAAISRSVADPIPVDTSSVKSSGNTILDPLESEKNLSPGLRLDPQVPSGGFKTGRTFWPTPTRLPFSINSEIDTLVTVPVKIPVTYAVIYFENEQSGISEIGLEKLKAIANTLQGYPKAVVSLKGFADHTGSIAYNMVLIEKRSHAVAQALKDNFGILPDKIIIQPGALLVRGPSKKPRKEDRMVEIQILF